MPSGRDTQSCTRVCHVVEGLGYGGAETLVHQLALRMRDTPFAPLVCCLQDGPVGEAMRRDGIIVESLDLPRRTIAEGPAFGIFVARVVARLRRVLHRHDVRLLHAHLHDPIIWASAAGFLHGTPVVGTYHGLGIMPAGRGALDPRNALRRALYRLAARHAARIIAVSSPVRDLLCSTLGFSPATTIVLTNGIDTAAFAGARGGTRVRAELGLDGRRVVTCVGRLVPNKGQALLVDALGELQTTHPDLVLLLVGDGPDRDALAAHAASRGVAARVVFASRRQDVADVLAASTLFVLPSFAEGIPLALLEAMAAGLPVVATAVPGTMDVVTDPSLGVLVPPHDAGALAAGIARLLDHPDEARGMALAGQAHVRRHFDLGSMVAATAALYQSVLAERVSGQRAAA
jgi:glycosyltransferase involved in cell wall biosynthesis